MKVINYRIELLEPALVTSLQGDPNSSVAFDYVPGSVLRGVFIGKYLNSKAADTSENTLRRLFFDGTTRYLNGYPLDAKGHPGMPVPASWHQVKGEKVGNISDFAIEAGNDKQQWQAVRAPFYTQSGQSVRLISPDRTVAVHTQRTARFGRAMPKYSDTRQADGKPGELLKNDEIPGAVYRYDALAAGQIFQAAIICHNDADEQILRDVVKNAKDGYITLGGSRSGGYGQARISWIAEEDADLEAVEKDENEVESGESSEENADLWAAEESAEDDTTEEDEDEEEVESSESFDENADLEAAGDDEDRPDGKIKRKLIVTLQSDVLLRDERGQFAVDPELLGQVLSGRLQVKLELEDAFLGTQVIGGFNRKWGLPLPQALAVSMGSVLVFKDPGLDPTLLSNVEASGIGERRAEGFGRLAFNQQRAAELKVGKNSYERPGQMNFTIRQTEAGSLAQLMVKRMLRKHLDVRLLSAANAVKIINPPSNAQISRLRGLILEELRKATPDIGRIRRFIAGIQARGSARQQFERSILDDREPLLAWLKRLLGYGSEDAWTMDDDRWKTLLNLEKVNLAVQLGDIEAKIDNGTRLEYVLHFIDLVLAHAAKERRKEN